jgi:hypothetical protein
MGSPNVAEIRHRGKAADDETWMTALQSFLSFRASKFTKN